jgi:hypothetical protein
MFGLVQYRFFPITSEGELMAIVGVFPDFGSSIDSGQYNPRRAIYLFETCGIT